MFAHHGRIHVQRWSGSTPCQGLLQVRAIVLAASCTQYRRPLARQGSGQAQLQRVPVLASSRREEILLPDLQRIQCRIVDPASKGQLLDGLEPANRFPRSWPDKPIDLEFHRRSQGSPELCSLLAAR